MNILKVIFTLSFFISLSAVSTAQNFDKVFVVGKDSESAPIGKYTYLFIDKEAKLSGSDIINNPNFKIQNKDVPFMVQVVPGNIWLRFSVFNTSNHIHYFLDLPYSNISDVTLYKLNGTQLQEIERKGNDLIQTGTNNERSFVFNLDIQNNDTAKYFLKVRSYHPVSLPLFIKQSDAVATTTTTENLVFGLYFGIIISLIFYNFFLLLSTRDLSYLFYVIYLFFLGLAQLAVSGYGFRFFWNNFPSINRYALVVTSDLAGITGILFAIFFLRVRYYLKNFIFLLSSVIGLYFLSIVLCVFGNNRLAYNILPYASLAGGILLIIIPIIIGKKGYRPAYFYLIAWSAFLAALIVFSLRNVGLLSYTTFNSYILYLGSAIEAILLSTALADRINTLRKEKEDSQVYALKISRENETLIREQNVILEQKVNERTNELQQSNMQLEKTLGDLKDAQIQLVEAEKMASLGQLTAGIAHEINNPINFVKSNIKPLRLDVEDLFEVISMYEDLKSKENGNLAKHLNEIQQKQEELDIDFIKNEIKMLIKGIEDGAERTAEIVRGLRTFSRLDESELKVANVHDGINSTLVLLRNNMPDFLVIEKDFKSKGNIECFPGKLNQVFMNILNNSIQAIESKKNRNEKEYIYISTKDSNDNNILISIKDTGTGMTEEVKHRIFEPFFTTKPVGDGTGLGMAIVFKIIEEHYGKIEVISELGKGSEFILTLPHIHPST